MFSRRMKDQNDDVARIAGRVLTWRRFTVVNLLLLVVVFLCVAVSLLFGPGGSISISDLFYDSYSQDLVMFYRLPTTLLAIVVGAALSVVGVAFQSLLRNPLADPFIMGVSGGAALGGTLAMVFLGNLALEGLSVEGPCAFLGALLATFLVYRIGRVGGRVDTLVILLVGVVFNAFAYAVIMFLKVVVSSTKTQEILYWLIGNLEYREYSTLLVVAGGVLTGIVVLFFMANRLNALSLGEDGAAHLGVNVERTKKIIFFVSSLLVGLAVAVSGLIGFVGFIVPQLMRLILGPDHRLLLPASALGGAAFLVLSELIGRLLFICFDQQVPVGAVTAFLGVPFFLLLLLRRHRMAFVG